MLRPETGRGRPWREVSDYSDYAAVAPLFHAFVELPDGCPERADMRRVLVEAHLPLAGNIARKFGSRGEPHADLAQVAAVGLVKAVDRFDPHRGSEFIPFAVPTVVGEIRQHLRAAGWGLHVPRRLKDLHLAIIAAVPRLSQRYQRAPTAAELAGHLGVAPEEVLEGLEAGNAYRPASLDAAVAAGPVSGSGVETLGAYDAALSVVENREALRPLLARLPPRDLHMLMLRFFAERTQTQIADEMGMSQVQVSRQLSRILTSLRRGLRDEPPPSGERATRPDP